MLISFSLRSGVMLLQLLSVLFPDDREELVCTNDTVIPHVCLVFFDVFVVLSFPLGFLKSISLSIDHTEDAST